MRRCMKRQRRCWGLRPCGCRQYLNRFFMNAVQVELPAGLTAINSCAFYKCAALENITIPDSVTFLGLMVFTRCSSLTEIRIPEKVRMLNSSFFTDCSNLRAVELPEGLK